MVNSARTGGGRVVKLSAGDPRRPVHGDNEKVPDGSYNSPKQHSNSSRKSSGTPAAPRGPLQLSDFLSIAQGVSLRARKRKDVLPAVYIYI